ncbi:MAG TPA: Crp/Fnr family transcriptional regulator [Cytophagaceae bacterium]|jgi:CRP-like cAMP-binding protein
MKFDFILDSVSKHISLTEEEKKYFLGLLEYKLIRKKQYILNQGEICRWSVFVISGCLRGFTTDKNAGEHVISFAPAGWWIADLYSLLSKQPGHINIEALEDTEVLFLYKDDQNILYEQVPKFEKFFRILAENALVANQQRVIDNLSISAEERYLKFCKTYPTLINALPQKHIATYIGVTQEFFSRMRTKLLREK